jgi:hypothetical protein
MQILHNNVASGTHSRSILHDCLFGQWYRYLEQELAGSPVFWPLPETYLPLLACRPRTWLLSSWNRFHPLISAREVPGG